jgi:peptide/nickel transport system substrate-binding protein
MDQPISRRSALSLALAGAGGILLAACGSASPAPSAPTSAAPASSAAAKAAASVTVSAGVPPASASPAAQAASGTPKSGGTLRQGYFSSPPDPNLDPHFKVGNDAPWFIYERLTAYDANLKPQPVLAESWDLGSNATQIKINLRKGVMFHTGRELTSDDIKYNVQRAANPATASGQYSGLASWFSGVETPDKYTAILKSDVPRPFVFDFFEFFNIGDKNTLEGPDAKNKAVGTGAFTMGDWVQGSKITLIKNKNYWQTGRPYLDAIEIPFYSDQLAGTAALEGGAIDMIRIPALTDFNRLKNDPKYQALADPLTGSHLEVAFNCTMPPFDNKLVRQALNYAIDRKRFVDTFLGGVGAPESLPWLPSQPAYDAARRNFFTFDLDKAGQLLAQAGVKDFEMDYWPNPVSDVTKGFAQIYQADLAKIGVKMNILTPDNATWLDNVNNRKYKGVYFASGIYFNLSPSTAFSTGKTFNPAGNNSGFSTDTYTNLITSSGSEVDPAKQKALLSQLNDLILDEAFANMVSVFPPQLIARQGVNGITWTAHESPSYEGTWLA